MDLMDQESLEGVGPVDHGGSDTCEEGLWKSKMARLIHHCIQRKRCSTSLSIICVLGFFSVFVLYLLSCPFETEFLNNVSLKKNITANSNRFSLGKQPTTVCNLNKAISSGIWTIEPQGRLGNQIGEYATLYALAKCHGKQAFIPSRMFNVLAPLFQITLPQLHDDIYKKIAWKKYPLIGFKPKEYKHINGKYIQFTNYPLSYKYFYNIKDEISREFIFHDIIRDEAHAVLATLKGPRKNATFIGVHVRRGDYAEYMARRWQGVIAGKAYVDKAMLYFRKKYQEPLFVVASNDMKWCKENIDASKGDVYFSGDGIESLPEKDFALLSHCNHSIMTLGTFGIWSSYLAGGETIYFKNVSLPGPGNKPFPYKNIYLPEWIGIPADL